MLILRVKRGARRGVGEKSTVIAQTYAEHRFVWSYLCGVLCVEAVMVSLSSFCRIFYGGDLSGETTLL